MNDNGKIYNIIMFTLVTLHRTKIILFFLLLGLSINTIAQGNARIDWVELITPTEAQVVETTYQGVIPLSGNDGDNTAKPAKFNSFVLTQLRSQLAGKMTADSSSLASLQLTGYGAPLGGYRRSEYLANSRVLGLKQELLQSDLGRGELSVSWVSEDWDSLLVLIEKSHIPLHIAAADIIRTVEVTKGREQQLMMLGDGHFYRQMQEMLCPQICRLEWRATVRRTVMTTAYGQIPIRGGQKTMSLSDLYELACRFEVGSQDFCTAVDLCERYFPDNDVARLNAAAVALVRGNIGRAARLLEGYSTDPRAYCNTGVLEMLRGNREQARVYLRMAAANGSLKALDVLSYMNQ